MAAAKKELEDKKYAEFAFSKNISDVELQNWYKVISQTTAKAEDIDSKMRFIESKSK